MIAWWMLGSRGINLWKKQSTRNWVRILCLHALSEVFTGEWEEYVYVNSIMYQSHLDYSQTSFCWAENTRAAYPIEFIPNVKLPCVGPHPKNVILLACDAFGVLPPVSKLSLAQTMYHFISGYTALVSLSRSLVASSWWLWSLQLPEDLLIMVIGEQWIICATLHMI
jgi:hypothetical protein